MYKITIHDPLNGQVTFEATSPNDVLNLVDEYKRRHGLAKRVDVGQALGPLKPPPWPVTCRGAFASTEIVGMLNNKD